MPKATTGDSIVDFDFTNPSITIAPGDTVTWTNNGGTAHTTTSNTGVCDSGQMAPGVSFSHTFNAVGTFPYHCTNHTFMTGTISVVSTAPAITSATTASGQVGSVFTYQITATNSPTSFGATNLPLGLSVNATTGAITGLPTGTGVTASTLSATGASGAGTATLTITINPPTPVISSAGTATGQVGVSFSYQITANNSPTAFSASNLPTGVTVNTTNGLISGTPTAAGSPSATIGAINAGGTGTATLSFTVLPAAPVITSALSASVTAGNAFTYQITASNAPTVFNAVNLPTGLNIDTGTGVISGTPASATVAAVTVSAGNTGGTGSATLTLTVNPPPPVITSTVTIGGTVGSTFLYQITATNAPTAFAATGLPGGLSVSSTSGAITGIPTASGSATVALSATNGGGTGTATLALTIAGSPFAPAVTSSGTANATVGSAFSYQITATNSPTTFAALGLPSGLSVDGNGLISGIPTTTGVITITVTATNGFGTGTASVILTVLPAPPVITSATTATGTVGATFSYQITASGSPTVFGASPLPAGLTINTGTGVISGSPTALGATAVTITAGNAGGTGHATVTITVLPPVPVITSALTASTVGSVLAYQITASGNPTSFGASGLPAGITVNTSNGLISGSSAAAGPYTVTISATNASGTGSATLALTVNATGGTTTATGTGTGTVASGGGGSYGGGSGGGGCGLGAGMAVLIALVAFFRGRRR